MKTWS